MFALTKFSTGKCDLLILQSYFRIDPVLGSLVIKQQESSVKYLSQNRTHRILICIFIASKCCTNGKCHCTIICNVKLSIIITWIPEESVGDVWLVHLTGHFGVVHFWLVDFTRFVTGAFCWRFVTGTFHCRFLTGAYCWKFLTGTFC